MLYTTKKMAIAEGFTHEGSYYGIPVWIRDPFTDEAPMVETKIPFLMCTIDALSYFEAACCWMLGRDHLFMFKVKDQPIC